MSAGLVPGDLAPDIDELQGREDAALAIPTRAEGPTRIQTLPLLPGVTRSIQPGLSDPQLLVKEDPTRARLLVWILYGDCYIGWDPQAVRDGTASLIPNGTDPIEFRSTGKLWVRSSVIQSTVSYITEHWTL